MSNSIRDRKLTLESVPDEMIQWLTDLAKEHGGDATYKRNNSGQVVVITARSVENLGFIKYLYEKRIESMQFLKDCYINLNPVEDDVYADVAEN